MNEKDLIRAVADECSISSSQAYKVFSSLASNIKKALKDKGSVTLKGLGTFTSSTRSKIAESNPLTGETISYSVTHVPEFQPVQELLSHEEEVYSLE